MAPNLSHAANESVNAPAEQAVPAQVSNVQPPHVTASSAPAAIVKPQPVTAPPAAPPTAKSLAIAPASAVTAKPIPTNPVATAAAIIKPQSAVAPHAPAVPVKPLPLKTLPAKPAVIHSAPQLTHTIGGAESNAGFQTIDIEAFVRDNCPQCDKAKEFLEKLQKLQPRLNIVIRDVRKEPAAMELLKRMTINQGDVTLNYPAFVVGGQLTIGFSEADGTAQLILDTLAMSHPLSQQEGINAEPCSTGKELSCDLIPPPAVTQAEQRTINLFGHSVPLLQIGLPLFTVAMGMLDGLNHGSTWVLILMISLLSPMKNRPIMFAIAGTFIASQGIAYYILMTGWFNLMLRVDMTHIAQTAIAGISLIAAAIHIKKYMHFGQTLALTSHEIAKPGIYTRIRKIVETENILTALFATIGLSLMVQITEFSYTSVFPALYTRILSMQQLDNLSNYGYLLLYDFAYLLDHLIVLCIGLFTMSERRAKDRSSSILKLISGLSLTGVGIYLLLASY